MLDTEQPLPIPVTPSHDPGFCPSQGQTVTVGRSLSAEEMSRHWRFRRELWNPRFDRGVAQTKPLSTIFLFYGNASYCPCDHIQLSSPSLSPVILFGFPKPETRTWIKIAYLGE